MKKVIIHEVGVASLGKLVGTWYAIVGLVVGVISAVAGTVGVIANNNYSILVDVLASIAIVIGSIVIIPVVLFLVGWLYGALMAVVFNVVIKNSGGLAIKTEDVK